MSVRSRASRLFRVGTRGSALALAQSRAVLAALKKKNPRHQFRLVTIRTTGDEFQSVEIFKEKGVGVFTKEIERALLQNKVDLAIHSLKDLPTDLPRSLTLASIPKRASARDVIVSRSRWSLKDLPERARVGTGSIRRKRQLALLRPDLRLVDMRGNLDTRVRRALSRDGLDAIVVAEAGLLRLKKYRRYACPMSLEKFLPAVGQGALGIQARSKDTDSIQVAKSVGHEPSERLCVAERLFLKTLRGGCRVPVGLLSSERAGRVFFRAAVYSVSSDLVIEASGSGPLKKALPTAVALARQLVRKGAQDLLRDARKADS